jgi:predicted nucleic acid-binding protein
VRAFFDTSVLIPVVVKDLPHSRNSSVLFHSVARKNAFCGAHTFAEVYGTITRLPSPYRVGPDHAALVLNDLSDRLNVVALNAEEYLAALQKLAGLGVTGGTVYDGLLAHCAVKAKADVIYTWNVRHFQQFGPEVARRLRIPDA